MGNRGRPDRAELGDRHLEFRQDFEQESLEFLVGAVDLVDQQHGRLRPPDRGEQRPFEQVFLGEHLILQCRGIMAASRLDRQELALVVPFIERMLGIDALVALQADEVAAENFGHGLRRLGLADARHALDQKRLAEPDREEHRRGQWFVGYISAGGKMLGHCLGRGEDIGGRGLGHGSTQ
jgi:hypothetical protein